MNLERLRWGEWIAGLAGLNLALVIFRSWYKVSGGDGRVTAWDALESGRYLLIATAILGVLLLVLIAAEQAEQMSFPPGALVALVGLGCAGYVAYRLATPPADGVDADIGLYLGLLSALGVGIGGLMSARDQGPGAVRTPVEADTSAVTPSGGGSTGPMTGPAGEPAGESWSPAPPAQSAGWSPAAPAASTGGWSPAAPAAPVPPATAAGGAGMGGADRPVQPGDDVALTAGGAKFPAGTVARVVEVFGGGALVEVVAADGVPERFEVPEQAYERVGAGSPQAASSPATGGESWSPAMPAPASGQGEDWGFGDAAAAGAGAAGGAAAGAAIASDGEEDESEKKPGFFKRLFGGGKAKGDEADQSQVDGDAADTAPTETWDEPAPAQAEPEPAPFAEESVAEQSAADPIPEPEPAAPEPEVIASEPEPSAPEPEPVASEPEPPAPEPQVTAADPIPEPEPPAHEPEVIVSAPEPEPEAAAPEPEPVASEPEPAAPEPVVEPDPAPEAESSAVDDPAIGGAAAAGAAGAAASDEPAAETPKPKRKRSSGSRKVPKEALGASAGDQPKVGDEVQLKVGGGKYDAGTTGRVVDVFSAGVIVELNDDEGRTERLDLPFEAVGPADA